MDVKSGEKKLLGEFPEWVNPGVRRLLQEGRPPPNVTVALDGTGDVKTIKEAMGIVPKKSKAIFIIYIKEGVYVENVVLDKSFWNVMIYGDGKDKSIVSANSKIKNHVIRHELITTIIGDLCRIKTLRLTGIQSKPRREAYVAPKPRRAHHPGASWPRRAWEKVDGATLVHGEKQPLPFSKSVSISLFFL
ncbi:hypothetical protein LXL04_033379 [Taraxacum kok-saghyz]